MGTYTDLSIAGYPLINSKSEVVSEMMTIFRESDRRTYTRKLSERNPLVWGEPSRADSRRRQKATEYTCKVWQAIDRLEVMGFTLKRAEDEFQKMLAARVAELKEDKQDGDDLFKDERQFLSSLTFRKYRNALRKVIARGLLSYRVEEYKKKGVRLDGTTRYILAQDDEGLFGYFGSDFRLLVRLACDVSPPNASVTQDITELIESGYYRADEQVCANAIQRILSGHPENSTRIVLTEGSTDAAILREALALLYPHLSGYYSFLEFEASRTPGGAGHLVSLVKAFAGAGVTNQTIALFDNDTAAYEATKQLAQIQLPRNIAVLHYPELDFLRNYPTLGPGGLTRGNVNGLAASIELYLGKEILLSVGAGYAPVQWKGYSEALKKYQGEVMHKAELRAAFNEKVKHCKEDSAVLAAGDWGGLKAILQKVIRAFA